MNFSGLLMLMVTAVIFFILIQREKNTQAVVAGYAEEKMNQDKEDKFKADFPQIFTDLHDCTPMESCMSWGIAIGQGWYDLLYNLCEEIVKLNPPEDFKAFQVKEKFGGLRFYVGGSTAEINKLIDVAEEESYKICEDCGSREEVTSEGRWVKTLCKKCRK